jgi:hypothetical protein
LLTATVNLTGESIPEVRVYVNGFFEIFTKNVNPPKF